MATQLIKGLCFFRPFLFGIISRAGTLPRGYECCSEFTSRTTDYIKTAEISEA
jgi:hypothetical protein